MVKMAKTRSKTKLEMIKKEGNLEQPGTSGPEIMPIKKVKRKQKKQMKPVNAPEASRSEVLVKFEVQANENCKEMPKSRLGTKPTRRQMKKRKSNVREKINSLKDQLTGKPGKRLVM